MPSSGSIVVKRAYFVSARQTWNDWFCTRIIQPGIFITRQIPSAAGMLRMPPSRFYVANILSAIIWAPALVFSGDLLERSLRPENLATKIFFITFFAAALMALGPWIRRRFLAR